MEKDIALGPEATAVLKVDGGNVVIGVNYAGKQVGAQVSVSLSIDQFAGLLKNAIPGTIDDTVIDLVVGALKAVAA